MFPTSWARRIADRIRGLPPRPRGARGAGWDWERAAERALAREGYRIVARNYRARGGEIDLIADDGGVLCFVEVKGRRSVAFGGPAESVTEEKQRRIERAAREWLARSREPDRPCRFDVVTVTQRDDAEPQVELLRDAFRLDAER